jgi:hypothetical protein
MRGLTEVKQRTQWLRLLRRRASLNETERKDVLGGGEELVAGVGFEPTTFRL